MSGPDFTIPLSRPNIDLHIDAINPEFRLQIVLVNLD